VVDRKRDDFPKHSADVLKALEGTAARQDAALLLWRRMLTPGGGLFPVDMVASGAVKRCLSQPPLLVGAHGSFNPSDGHRLAWRAFSPNCGH
jgi:hypothetical protein